MTFCAKNKFSDFMFPCLPFLCSTVAQKALHWVFLQNVLAWAICRYLILVSRPNTDVHCSEQAKRGSVFLGVTVDKHALEVSREKG